MPRFTESLNIGEPVAPPEPAAVEPEPVTVPAEEPPPPVADPE